MYTLKSIAQRGTLFGAAAALVLAAVLPATSVFADALNPLTDRSLSLSSSAPGWDYKDGSGNTTYAPPNSGANGQKTGNTFDFKVSTDSTVTGTNAPVKAMTFQYCTTSAGTCLAPGDNGWTGTAGAMTAKPNSATTSNLNITQVADLGGTTGGEVTAANFGTYVDTTSTGGAVKAIPPASSTGNNYVVYYRTGANTWAQSTGWSMYVSNKETGTVANGDATGANNYITLTNAGQGFTAGQEVKVVFFATDTNYITNPGSSWFFVKINTYKNIATAGTAYSSTGPTPAVAPVVSASDIIDGGVTVANVMNHSIRIQTKVLETMAFSVGTVDPDTLASNNGSTTPATPSTLEKAKFANTTGLTGVTQHQVCDPILNGMTPSDPVNVLSMGNQAGENSLETGHTYSTHSFWRLSSNSSAGATVYYSGHTLSNTVNDTIAAMGTTKIPPAPGSAQFGLALATNQDAGVFTTNYNTEGATGAVYEQGADGNPAGIHASQLTDVTTAVGPPVVYNASWHAPQLAPLTPAANYSDGAGNVNNNYNGNGLPINTKFAFDNNSTLIPVPIASENSQVVDCVTGRMRYVANIAATTPAGIYTTAINYIAAPQY